MADERDGAMESMEEAAELQDAAGAAAHAEVGEGATGGAAGPAPAPTEPRPPAGHVPLAALHEERERRRELQARLGRLQRQLQAGQDGAARAAAEAAEAAADPEPDKARDLPAWLEWRDRQSERRLAAVERQARAQAEAAQRVQALHELRGHVQRQEAEFRAQTPDYDAAYEHAIAHERRRLAEIEGIADPAAQDRILAQIERQFVLAALQQGRNPAEAVYRYACFAGYRPGGTGGGAQPPSGDRPEAMPAARPAPRSLGAARSAAAAEALTPEALAEMSEAEFRRLTATAAGRARVNALLGEGFVAEW